MTYFAPYIDDTGLHFPTFEDIKEYYTSGAQGIFGEDIYVDSDSMDGQLISIFAKGCYDTMQVGEYAYNNYSPQTAVGNVLSQLVRYSGVTRNESSYSTVYLELTGTAYTQINNGVVQDYGGNKWNLPSSVNLGANGVVYVTATAQEEGAITATVGTVTTIVTPTAGWKSVTNTVAANPAQALETDTELRERQAETVELPSQGLLAGTQSALLEVDGVTDVICKENYTSSPITEQNVTLPAHSITCIVLGGGEEDIAQTIFYHKNQGVLTNGTTTVTVYDKYHNINEISFIRPADIPIYVSITIKPVYDYTSDYETSITDNIVEYITSLNIADDVIQSVLYHKAYGCNDDLTRPAFSIQSLLIGTSSSSLAMSDIEINLDQKASIEASNITITVES